MSCGLKLLDTVLALDEAVVFRVDERGALAQAARLRSQLQGAGANASDSGERHSAWREGVRMCERAVASRELMIEESANGGRSNVAAPLVHEGRAVGALLLRLRERFDETDAPLLSNVSAQLARNLQREDARSLDVPKARQSFFSSRAARQRLEAFGVVTGLLPGQGFAGR